MGIEFGNVCIFADGAEVGPILDLDNFEESEMEPTCLPVKMRGEISITVNISRKQIICMMLGIRNRRKARWRNIVKAHWMCDYRR